MSSKRTAITIGTFDGIHLGHRALLSKTQELANAQGLESIAFTFQLPPQNYLGRKKPLLMPPDKKLALLSHYVDRVEIADFVSIQPLSPEEFVAAELVNKLHGAGLVIGENFCFGRNRQGNVATLEQLGPKYDFSVEIVPPVLVDGRPVSSTAIREALASGDVIQAQALLGKPHRLWGVVIEGSHVAQTYGFPTANLQLDEELLIPSHGIYASHVLWKDKRMPAALYIGTRPTMFGENGISVEVHIIDEQGLELYGEELEVQLLHYIRPDKEFSSEDKLKDAIARDIESVRHFFSR